jgi:hypothetical protein
VTDRTIFGTPVALSSTTSPTVPTVTWALKAPTQISCPPEIRAILSSTLKSSLSAKGAPFRQSISG